MYKANDLRITKTLLRAYIYGYRVGQIAIGWNQCNLLKCISPSKLPVVYNSRSNRITGIPVLEQFQQGKSSQIGNKSCLKASVHICLSRFRFQSLREKSDLLRTATRRFCIPKLDKTMITVLLLTYRTTGFQRTNNFLFAVLQGHFLNILCFL